MLAFADAATLLARAQVPTAIAAAIALGRLVALRKPSGGSRGLVVGDLLRRLVARTLAQQFSQQLDAACHPHQYALSTRTGAEALVHTLQAKTQADTHLTVLSVDISAAYDTVSREAMLSALREVPQASALMPFVRLWYARESVYVWAAGSQAHRITQAEGGEQGDPLMPALFALAFAPALRDLHADLRPDEQALAFLDDAYILAPPHRVLELYQRFERHALHRAQLRLNPGKTRVWNSAGVHPVGVDSLAPDSDVWVGNRALDSAQRGFVALGVPFGTPEFIAAFLETLLAKQRTLLDRLLLLADTQVAWLFLCFCAAPRAQYALRTLPPADTRAYAAGHDAAILCCLGSLLLPACLLWLPPVHSSRCATVDLDSAAPSAMPSRRFGHLGPTRSQPSRVETVPSLKPSRVLWMAPGLCLTPWLP